MAVNQLQKKIQNQAYRLVWWQLAGVVMLSAIGLLISLKNSYSVLLGGLAYGLPNLLFVFAVFRYSGAQQMTQFMTAFMAGEMFKLVLSGILFLMIVKYLPVSLSSVLVGFAGAIVAFWIVCFRSFSRQNNSG